MTLLDKSLVRRLWLTVILLIGGPVSVIVATVTSASASGNDWFDIEVFGAALSLAGLAVLVALVVLASCLFSETFSRLIQRRKSLRLLQMLPFVAGPSCAAAAFLIFRDLGEAVTCCMGALFVTSLFVVFVFMSIALEPSSNPGDARKDGSASGLESPGFSDDPASSTSH